MDKPKKEVKWTPPKGYTVFESGDGYCVLQKNNTAELIVYSEQFGLMKPDFSVEDMRATLDLVRRLLAKGEEDD